MKNLKQLLDYLKKHKLVLATAESCTAGRVIDLLAKISGSGECLDAGYVVYSTHAKKRLLGVKQKTIDQFTLTSEEVVREMAIGALEDSIANTVVATTGIAGSKPMDGIEPGTICLAWGFKTEKESVVYTETKHFDGTRNQVQKQAAQYVLINIPLFYERFQLQHKLTATSACHE